MWTLISRMNLAGTRRRLARHVVAAAVVVSTGTHVAMVRLPNPASPRPEPGQLMPGEVCELLAPSGVAVS